MTQHRITRSLSEGARSILKPKPKAIKKSQFYNAIQYIKNILLDSMWAYFSVQILRGWDNEDPSTHSSIVDDKRIIFMSMLGVSTLFSIVTNYLGGKTRKWVSIATACLGTLSSLLQIWGRFNFGRRSNWDWSKNDDVDNLTGYLSDYIPASICLSIYGILRYYNFKINFVQIWAIVWNGMEIPRSMVDIALPRTRYSQQLTLGIAASCALLAAMPVFYKSIMFVMKKCSKNNSIEIQVEREQLNSKNSDQKIIEIPLAEKDNNTNSFVLLPDGEEDIIKTKSTCCCFGVINKVGRFIIRGKTFFMLAYASESVVMMSFKLFDPDNPEWIEALYGIMPALSIQGLQLLDSWLCTPDENKSLVESKQNLPELMDQKFTEPSDSLHKISSVKSLPSAKIKDISRAESKSFNQNTTIDEEGIEPDIKHHAKDKTSRSCGASILWCLSFLNPCNWCESDADDTANSPAKSASAESRALAPNPTAEAAVSLAKDKTIAMNFQ